MPLPQQIINQLVREPAETRGWLLGAMLFAGGLLLLVLAIYFGMVFAYEPYLSKKIANTESQIATLSQSIPSGDEAGLISYYSGIINLRTLLQQHVAFSQFLAWLEKNTQSNVFYSQFSFGAENQIAITGNAKTQADLTQQIAIFESSPKVQKAVVSNVGISGATGLWQFTATLIMDPSVFVSPFQSAMTTATST
jgi:hypothetical protein